MQSWSPSASRSPRVIRWPGPTSSLWVSAKSPITTLSMSQVADIFSGKASRFPNGVQALPIDQAEGSAIRDEFYSKVVGKNAAQIKAYWSKIIFTGRGQPPPSVSNSIEMKKRISENLAAIGYIDRSLVDDSVRAAFCHKGQAPPASSALKSPVRVVLAAVAIRNHELRRPPRARTPYGPKTAN